MLLKGRKKVMRMRQNKESRKKQDNKIRKQSLVEILSHLRRLILILDNIIQRTQAYNFLMWFPYYFEKMGFEFSLTFISTCYYLVFIPGTIIFEQIMENVSSEKWQKHIGCLFLFVSVVLTIYLRFIEAKE